VSSVVGQIPHDQIEFPDGMLTHEWLQTEIEARKPFSMERLLEILHEQGLEDSGVNPRGEARR